MSTRLPINLTDLLRQCTVEGERIEYKAPDHPHTLCANVAGDWFRVGSLIF